MRTKQIEESKTMIIDALFTLIESHDYETITISDIARRAGVSRMTVYRYYVNKSQIIQSYIQLVIHELEVRLHGQKKVTFETLLLERNKIIYYDPRIRLAFQYELIEEIFREVITQSNSTFRSFLPANQHVPRVMELFVQGGITNITRDWVLSGMKASPEEITADIMKVIIKLQRSRRFL